jgi:RNA polymerase sigma factor (TIGR02999 family)
MYHQAAMTEPARPDNTPGPRQADELFQATYRELRQLAVGQLAHEQAGLTLTATALVHEAYLRLAGRDAPWNGRTHFLRAAARAMRHILVSHARGKNRLKRGGGRQRVDLDGLDLAVLPPDDQLLALEEALSALAAEDPLPAEVVELRYFAGADWPAVAEALDAPVDEVKRHWAYARAWLFDRLNPRG